MHTLWMRASAVKVHASFTKAFDEVESLEDEKTEISFTDIAFGAWYYNAVAYVYENRMMNGIYLTLFGPDVNIIRGMLVTILYRYAAYKEYDVSDSASLNQYTDADDINPYAVESTQWAVAMGLVKGVSATTLAPANNASGTQIATVFIRFCEFYRA